MDVVPFASVAVAVEDLREKGREYLIGDYRLLAGNNTPDKVHQSKGWIILHPGRGRCNVKVGGYSQTIELSPEYALMLLVPAGIEYSLNAISDISYTVLRDGFD